MELLRRPTVLAVVAAVVLVVDLVVLVTDGSSSPDAVDDVASEGETPADAATEPVGDGAGQDGGTTGEQGADGGTATDGGSPAGEQDGAGEDGSGQDGGDAGDGGTGDVEGLAVPPAGTYAYTAAGTWSFTTSDGSEDYQLPATASADVTTDGGTWEVRLAAGERYADRFTFVLGPEDGLDWTGWVLERTFADSGGETVYSCSGDEAFYRSGEPGRTASHTCRGPQGIVSEGTVEVIGAEDVTLGDGSVVTADRLLYTYTVGNDSLTGEGRLDLWLDPATGLRVREVRSITTTTTGADGSESTYDEDVEFTLQSTTPA